MKTKNLKMTVSFILVMLMSCGEPETVVTNIIHPDGKVTRKVEMKSQNTNFDFNDIQVPLDSTWTFQDSLEVNDDDTVWVRRASKTFTAVEEINREYAADSGCNRETTRRAEFNKKFRWFFTEYRFSEIVEKQLKNGYPISGYLNEEERRWFYSPQELKESNMKGPDSVKYKSLNDSVDVKSEHWVTKSLASEWLTLFSELVNDEADSSYSLKALKAREDEFIELAESSDDIFDDDSSKVFFLEFMGSEDSDKYLSEFDSATSILFEKTLKRFTDYSVRIDMPGELTNSNGFIDSTGILQWPVESDFFISEDYVMWAESRTRNTWAWIVTGVFILFVLAGIIFRSLKK